ncbi:MULTISPECIES: dTDP-glucose 4,6-dehydratase [unclassified Nocardiopsis]|uniref:dTDP-glucose 4,6-dehydratase n=1 Tax=Nocardiopsis TaxID=2013 RepID=UPI00387ADC69
MRVLVTGGAGFIGSCYVRSLLQGAYPGFEDARVTVLDKLTYAGNLRNLDLDHPRLDFVRGDVCDGELLRGTVAGHDAVVHFAAESHVDRSIRGAAEFVRTNVLGTQVLLEVCAELGVEPVVLVSTDEVYGSIEEGDWTESSPLLPNSPYSASKAAGDLFARAHHRTFGLDVRVTRCANNYGPFQHVEKLVPLFVTNLLAGHPVPLYGNGTNVREWIHVSDHCRAIQLVLTEGSPGRVYNIGGHPQSNWDVTRRLLDLCGAHPDLVTYVEDRPGHDVRYALDDTLIREELGYREQVTFEQGLADVVQWYRDRPDWWKPLLSRPV